MTWYWKTLPGKGTHYGVPLHWLPNGKMRIIVCRWPEGKGSPDRAVSQDITAADARTWMPYRNVNEVPPLVRKEISRRLDPGTSMQDRPGKGFFDLPTEVETESLDEARERRRRQPLAARVVDRFIQD